jgi:type II secretory pathway pseudopilin PulG
LLLIALAGCAKKPAGDPQGRPPGVDLVPQAEQSRHFDAVNRHLELGGTLYGFADVDGDALDVADRLQSLVGSAAANQPQLAPLEKQDFKALFTDLGLNDVKAVGFSSVRDTAGNFRNRTFFYMPEGRHGLFAAFGGPPGPFVDAKLAPSDTDFYSEFEFNVGAVYDTVKAVIAKVSGPEAAASFEKQVKEAGLHSGFSAFDIIEGLNGRATVILRLDPHQTFAVSGPLAANVPAFYAVVRIEGIGGALEGALVRSGEFNDSHSGTFHIFQGKKPSPIQGIEPVLAIDGKTFYAATTSAFLFECVQRTVGLNNNAAFASALAALGPEGNGVTWISPGFFDAIRELAVINPTAPPAIKKALASIVSGLPPATQPLVSVRSNLPDGILVRSNWNGSLKPDLAMFTVYNPVTVGLMAAMAVPAFQKVRQNSQEKAVLNNLRMLSAAADEYYLDSGVTTATFDQLVGPDKVVKQMIPVAGEDYRKLVFRQGLPLHIRLADGRVVAYPQAPRAVAPSASGAAQSERTAAPDAAPTSDEAILENLRKLSEAANKYYADHNTTTTTFEQLVGPEKYLPSISPVAGENYRSLLFKQGRPLRLYLRDGRVLAYPW